MATFTHYLQGSSDTEITDSDKLQFAGGDFGSRISVDEFNDSTHVEDDGGSDKSDGNSPNNNNYDDESLPLSDGDCALKITFDHDTSVEIEDAEIYAHDSGDSSASVSGVDIYMAESGDSDWTNAEGDGDALSLGDKTTADTSHDFYVGYTAGPTEVGEKDWTYTIELTYF